MPCLPIQMRDLREITAAMVKQDTLVKHGTSGLNWRSFPRLSVTAVPLRSVYEADPALDDSSSDWGRALCLAVHSGSARFRPLHQLGGQLGAENVY